MKNVMTRNGIVHDLRKSPHKFIISYKENYFVTFFFSSELYKTKFEERLYEHRQLINSKLSKRFHFAIQNESISDVVLYSTIEKRGFLIKSSLDNKEIPCLEKVRLDGKNEIAKI